MTYDDCLLLMVRAYGRGWLSHPSLHWDGTWRLCVYRPMRQSVLRAWAHGPADLTLLASDDARWGNA